MIKQSVINCIIITAFITAMSSCRFGSHNAIFGNGNVTIENRTISSFTKLRLDGAFKTIISQDGGPAWVKVETDQNLQQAVKVSNEGGTLEIANKSEFNFNKPTKMVVYVNVKDLSSLSNTSVGKVETKGPIKTDELDLNIDAVGKTSLEIQVRKLTATINSVGVIVLAGSAASANIDNNSVGKLEAYGLKTDTLNIKNNSVGAVEVYAEKEISIDHNGVGSLHYKGPATVKSLTDNGVGKASKAD
jgi:hypothetical protein